MADQPKTTRALWFVEPRRVEIRDEPLPRAAPGEVVAHGLASAISQGTELLLYRGEGPATFDDSIPSGGPTRASAAGGASSRSDQTGQKLYARRYGYSWVGEIVAGDDARTGERIFALATHAEHHVLRGDDARAIPRTVPATRAVLAANLETAITCTWDCEVGLGDRVVVLGGGVVGALSAWLLARSGAEVTLVERSARRRAAASALVPNASIVAAATPDARADVVVEATGDPRTLDDAIAWCANEARIVVASFYGIRRAETDLGNVFHRRRLELRATQVSSLPPRLRGRWTFARRWQLVVSLLEEPALDALVGEPAPFEKASDVYARLDGDDDLPPAHVFVYR